MYLPLATLAVLVFVYSVFAKRLENSVISGPMFFVLFGYLCGPYGFNLIDAEINSTQLRVIVDLTLAFILFTDASHANIPTLKRYYALPARMLLIGLPCVIFLGTLFATLVFTHLSFIESAILATMLAATDAALGKAVVSNKRVPERLREGLNAESGLNDGLCVPVLLLLIALAQGSHDQAGQVLAMTFFVEELGIGLLVGLGLTAVASYLMKYCFGKTWVNEMWLNISVIALALSNFAIAQELHGSGYIATFSGGLLFGYLMRDMRGDLLSSAESEGELMAMLTWFLFGAAVIGSAWYAFSWEVVLYSILSLTVIRIIPVFISLIASGETFKTKLFLAWFGPRGLASIVFAIIVVNNNVENSETLTAVVVCTVLLSLIAHGVSANPFINWLSRSSANHTNHIK